MLTRKLRGLISSEASVFPAGQPPYWKGTLHERLYDVGSLRSFMSPRPTAHQFWSVALLRGASLIRVPGDTHSFRHYHRRPSSTHATFHLTLSPNHAVFRRPLGRHSRDSVHEQSRMERAATHGQCVPAPTKPGPKYWTVPRVESSIGRRGAQFGLERRAA